VAARKQEGNVLDGSSVGLNFNAVGSQAIRVARVEVKKGELS
jgi:hypothetical protein